MRNSIKTKTFVTILLTIFSILFVTGLLMSSIAGNYYLNKKVNEIDSATKTIERIIDVSDESTNFSRSINTLAVRLGVSIMIIDSDGSIIFSDFGVLSQGLKIFNQNPNRRLNIVQENTKRIRTLIEDVKLTDDSIIEKITTKGNGGGQSTSDTTDIYLYAKKIKDDNILIAQLPVESVAGIVDIIRRMILLMLVIGTVIGSLAAYILSKNITNPLIQLKQIAGEISQLNFETRYTDDRKDEIGQLGHTLNKLSSELELSISGLEQELEKEKTLDVLRKQFIAQVSHEIQTPMAIIKGYVEAMEDGIAETEEEKKYHYQVIRDEISKMTRMTKEMMDLAQLEAGTYIINKEVMSITTLVNQLGEKYQTYVQQEGKHFSYEVPEEQLYINGDNSRIEQVIANFMKNAVIHTTEADIINLSLESVDDTVTIKVSNTGSKIPETDIEHIWESFYKASNNDTQKGTGLGLAISKHIITLHNGSYGAENTVDGVTFWVKLKRIK